MPTKDASIIKELVEQVAAIAATKHNLDTKKMWINNNTHKPNRPLVLVDQLPWHELNIDNQLSLQCTDVYYKYYEDFLRKIIFKHKYMPVDMVVDNYVTVPRCIGGGGYGLGVIDESVETDSHNNVTSHNYIDQLEKEDDISKIHYLPVFEDMAGSRIWREKAEQIFGNLIKTKPSGYDGGWQLWDLISMWRGVSNCLYDMIDRPEYTHAILAKMTDCALQTIKDMNSKKLFCVPQSLIHCTHAYLPENEAKMQNTEFCSSDVWAMGMSQIMSSASPTMHEEFEVPYLSQIFSQFKDVYYGCCEPLHDRIAMIRKYKNVRKISISPWANPEIAAESMGSDYIMSFKPNPAMLVGNIDEANLTKYIRRIVDCCKANGTPLEIILKDVSTIEYDPNKLFKWCDIVMKAVNQ